MKIFYHWVWIGREKNNHIVDYTHFTGKHQNVKSTYLYDITPGPEIRMWDLDTLYISMLGFEATIET